MRWVLLLAFLLAGCTAEQESEDPVQVSGTRSSQRLLDLENATQVPWSFVDCRVRPIIFDVPEPVVQEHVPPGYNVRSPYGLKGLASVIVHQYTCQALVLDNETVTSPLSLLYVSTGATPEPTPDDALGELFYQFEIYADNRTVVAALAGAGLPAEYASIEGADDAQNLAITVTVEGGLRYEIDGHVVWRGAPQQVFEATHFHGDQADVGLQLTLTHNAGGLVPYTTTVTAHSGILADMASGSHAGHSLPGDADVVARFLP